MIVDMLKSMDLLHANTGAHLVNVVMHSHKKSIHIIALVRQMAYFKLKLGTSLEAFAA